MIDIKIEHQKDAQQFVAVVEGKTSLLTYTRSGDGKTLNYRHTFVPPELRGRHIGQDLVKFALDFAKENNYQVIPSCPFVKLYIDRNPKYKDLISQ